MFQYSADYVHNETGWGNGADWPKIPDRRVVRNNLHARARTPTPIPTLATTPTLTTTPHAAHRTRTGTAFTFTPPLLMSM